MLRVVLTYDTELKTLINQLEEQNANLKKEVAQLRQSLSGTKNDAKHWQANHQ